MAITYPLKIKSNDIEKYLDHEGDLCLNLKLEPAGAHQAEQAGLEAARPVTANAGAVEELTDDFLDESKGKCKGKSHDAEMGKGKGKFKDTANQDLVSARLSEQGSGVNIRLLSVGSGDGSQLLSLAFARTEMVVTFFDEEETVKTKYKNAKHNIELLSDLGAEIRYGIDARKLADYPELGKFDVISFYFPQTYKAEEASSKLVREFLEAASRMLHAGGEIHVTCDSVRKGTWIYKGLLDELGLTMRECRANLAQFAGYTPVNVYGGDWLNKSELDAYLYVVHEA